MADILLTCLNAAVQMCNPIIWKTLNVKIKMWIRTNINKKFKYIKGVQLFFIKGDGENTIKKDDVKLEGEEKELERLREIISHWVKNSSVPNLDFPLHAARKKVFFSIWLSKNKNRKKSLIWPTHKHFWKMLTTIFWQDLFPTRPYHFILQFRSDIIGK